MSWEDDYDNLVRVAMEWANMDPNPLTKKQVMDYCRQEEETEKLMELFPPSSKRIGFGTAGLRGEMKAGPMGMNDLTVIQTTQGLAHYYYNIHTNNKRKMMAVIGYDHRCCCSKDGCSLLSSKGFAKLAKAVLEESNYQVIVLDGYVATPLVAFAVRYLQATVGIMMTASHNPAKDAGYKVYHSNGCQIRSPIDKHIAMSIQNNLTPWSTNYYINSDSDDTAFTDVEMTQQIVNAYYNTISTSLLSSPSFTATTTTTDLNELPPMVYTAMHGVGFPWAQRLFQQQQKDWPMFVSVPEQQLPDPTFPTVSFPNPEESGALDMAMNLLSSLSSNNKSSVVVAHDPDADRMALAEFSNNTWTTFTGDQIGVMLGHHLWNTIGKNSSKPVAMCVSTVSSCMLSVIAKKEGFYLEETLTGFKWIGSRLVELAESEEGYHSLFGYEEAIGFCCNPYDGNVYDKDGIRAMAVLSNLLYHHLIPKEKTLGDYMQELYHTYGEFVSNNGYYYCTNMSKVTQIMKQSITTQPLEKENNEAGQSYNKYITHVGPYEIESIRDLGYYMAYDSTTDDNKPTMPVSSSSPMLTLRFTNGCVAQFRGSGTEPKFKYYIEMCGQPGVPRTKVQSDLVTMSTILLNELLHPNENNDILQLPK